MVFSLKAHAAGARVYETNTLAAIDTSGANLLIGFASTWGASSPTGIQDPRGNSWVALADQGSGGTLHGRFYYSIPTSVGSGHVFTYYQSYTTCAFYVAAFGGASASPLDAQNTAGSTGQTPQPGSVSPAQDDELIVAAIATGETTGYSINQGFGITDFSLDSSAQVAEAMAYLIQSAKAAVIPAWTLSASRSAACAIATFKKGVLTQAPFVFQSFAI